MGFAKIFRLGKKGAKKLPKGKKKAEPQAKWPSGTRVGVYGHTNSGKTCYFTVLNECCKTDRRLQISVSDHGTAAEFLKNYRSIWGLATAVESGTAVDLAGEKKFPDPTKHDKVIIFNATVDRGRKLTVVSYDYPGKAVDINEASDLKEKVTGFMAEADGLLFFYDPKLLQAELQNQAHVASFVNMIEQIAPLDSRLPVPIGLVIVKADILPGFTGEDQTVLIHGEDEALLAEDYDMFLQRVLESNRIASNSAWAGTVRELLLKLRDFLRVVVGRTLDFQIFFSSNTGKTPEKIGTDVGRSIYTPPARITPVGVKEPMHWILNAIVRNRRISRFRFLAKWAAMLSLIWIIVFSIPFLFHFSYLLPKAQRVERDILKAYDGNVFSTSPTERGRIARAYREYKDAKTVKWLFPAFVPPADRIRAKYDQFNLADAEKALEGTIERMAGIVADTSLWPAVNPTDSSIITQEEHEKLLADLQSYHQGDEESKLYQRSDRVLNYWDLFTKALQAPNDTTYWNIIKRQVQQDQALNAKEISAAERQLGQVLMDREVKKVQKVIAQQTAFEFSDEIVSNVNDNPSPAYRLDRAVRDLRTIMAKLDQSDIEHRRMIERYVEDAKAWSRYREYKAKIETLPGNAHIHVEVTDSGEDPAWTDLNQIFEGDEITIRWKPGQDIHVALDTPEHPCQWGKNPADKVVLSDKYALFDLEKGLSFENVGKKVTVHFEPPLTDRLPKLE